MPQAKLERVVSCSSEDPAHPSKNLLLSREYNRKWKCKEPGEQCASVIIQLTEPHIISGIDIGNESSSFIEVLVSRTSTPDEFQVLLVMSSFMTPMDARAETNRNRVRMFSHESLSEPVRKEKWDRIKVVCTQPFNKHLQYGLSFIVLHTSESKHEVSVKPKSPAKALGRFALKDDDDEGEISIGSFFTRRKDLQASPPRPAPLSGAAAVRDASLPINVAEQKATKKRKGSDDLTDSQRKKRGRPPKNGDDSPSIDSVQGKLKKNDSPLQVNNKPHKNVAAQSTDDISSSNAKLDKRSRDCDVKVSNNNSDSSDAIDKKERKKLKALDDNAGPSTSSHSNSQRQQLNPKQTEVGKGNITYKPFNKLLEGVEIVISGYENPGRSHIREKALQMGSRYNGNWSSTSTHLICAFPNTPKFRQVQGKGTIVTREWIDDCFQERKKLSWRRYATDKNERSDVNNASEPEVWEFVPSMDRNNDSPLPPVSRRNNIATQDTRLKSDSEDSEDEIERIRVKQNMKMKRVEERNNKERNLDMPRDSGKKTQSYSSDSEARNERIKEKQLSEKKKLDEDSSADPRGSALKVTGIKKDDQSQDNDEYNCSTDVDSEEEARSRLTEWSKEQKNEWSKDKLPPLPDFFKEKSFFLTRDLSEADRQSLNRYIVAFGGEVLLSDPKSAHFIVCNNKCEVPEGLGSISCVTPDWIWECNDRQRLIPAILYEPD